MTQAEMEQQLENLDRRLVRVERILPTLATKKDLQAVRHRTEVLTEAVRDDIRIVAEGVAALTTKVDTLTHGLASVSGRLGSVTDRVDSLTGGMGSLTGNVNSLTGKVDSLAGGVDSLTGRLERKGVI